MRNISVAGWFLEDEDGFELKVDGNRYMIPSTSTFSNSKIEIWDMHDPLSDETVGRLKVPTNSEACYFEVYGGKEYYTIEKMFKKVRWGEKDVAPVFPTDD